MKLIWVLGICATGIVAVCGSRLLPPGRKVLQLVDPSTQLDPSAWAPFLPPPNLVATSTNPPPPNAVYSPPPPLQKPSAVVLPPWLVGAPAASPSPSPVPAELQVQLADKDRKINKAVLLTFILVPILLGVSILLSTLVAWMCQRPPSLRHSPASSSRGSTQDYSDRRSSSFGRGPFAPWLWSRSAFGVSQKEVASLFEYTLLQTATDNFSTGNLLGEGRSGRVYRARLDEDSFAAVKLLYTEGKQAEQGFQAEVEFLSRIRHPNLVSLLGFCSSGEHRLLVYEFMQNGSLQDQLHGPSRGSALTWFLRLKIALDSARGLEHLHEHCSPLVVHRDFKSSNILLDASFNAKVADFGLALSTPRTSVQRDAIVQGTLGYVAPEYMLNGSLTEKSDVYAFGVVLLELITGKKPVDDSLPTGCESLVSWVMPFLAHRETLTTVVDPILREAIDPKHLQQVAAVAVLCVQTEPSYRPLIADVVNSLTPLVPLELGGSLQLAEVVPESKSFAALQWNSSSDDCIEAYEEELYY